MSSFHALKNITGNRVAVIRDNGKAFGTLLLYNFIDCVLRTSDVYTTLGLK